MEEKKKQQKSNIKQKIWFACITRDNKVILNSLTFLIANLSVFALLELS